MALTALDNCYSPPKSTVLRNQDMLPKYSLSAAFCKAKVTHPEAKALAGCCWKSCGSKVDSAPWTLWDLAVGVALSRGNADMGQSLPCY